MKSLNSTCCIKLEKKGFKIVVVDIPSKKVVWQKSLACDFDILDNAGVVINPTRTASFIQKSINELEVPKKLKVSLGLEFVSLNRLTIPPVSGPELERIVIDEAERESPFSFTNEKIAVTYQVLKDPITENGAPGMEVIAVTTPQNVVDKIVEVFRNTDFILEAVSPSLFGLKHYLIQQQVDIAQPFILIFIELHNAEFYVWEGEFATSFHYIRFGAKDIENLQKEITASLEHFSNNPYGKLISQVVIAGEKCEIQLDSQYTIKHLTGDGWSDLAGLASNTKITDNLNFITQTTKESPKTQEFNKFWPVMLGGIILLNVPIGWNLWSGNQQITRLKNENSNLREILNVQIIQLEELKQVDTHFKIHSLLESVREIVSKDIMFERLVLDIEGGNMQLEGFCLGENTINYFIQGLSRIKGIKSIDRIQISEQMRVNLNGYVFSFQVNLNRDTAK